ncbi:hypothetical protein ABEW34_23305 [Paenibacillus algorifonticola]|uniref:hypothetical protein n=1 Tax=Paenibacillus algorifonticola TaxID=684063 RepID=UPI003D2DE354
MNIHRTVFYTTLFSALIFILLSVCIEYSLIKIENVHVGFIGNILIGLFTSSLVSVIISLSSYLKEKRNLDTRYYVISSTLLSSILCVIEYVEENKKIDDVFSQNLRQYDEKRLELMYLLNTEKYLLKKSKYSKFAESVLTRTLKTLMLINEMKALRESNSDNSNAILQEFKFEISNKNKKSINELVKIHKESLMKKREDRKFIDYYEK